MSMQTKPSIVFVHGIWADGSSFGKVIANVTVRRVRRGRPTQPGHARRRRRNGNPHAGAGQRSDHARGHSCGGTVITAAGTEAEVVHRGQGRPHRPARAAALRGEAMGATVYDEIDSTHVPMLSNPGVIDVIRVATNAVRRITTKA
jgi:hypothetical protein